MEKNVNKELVSLFEKQSYQKIEKLNVNVTGKKKQ